MSNNSFGNLFRITTWGESHGKAIGVVIDGCPAGLALDEEEIQRELLRRQPGKNPYTSARREEDRAEILSGVFQGQTTGAPISIIIYNKDADTASYAPLQHALRPGHAHFTYLEKYGLFDYRGGGRASARETACRVAAGAVAKKLLAHTGIALVAYVKEIGGITAEPAKWSRLENLRDTVHASRLYCPDPNATVLMQEALEKIRVEGDSLGGIVEAVAVDLPIGLGDPVYEKLEANLAKAMLSLPATKGFEMGTGFKAAVMTGSQHNDLFFVDEEQRVLTKTNHAGGTLGGITTGMPLVFRVAFKPTSTIRKTQETLTTEGKSMSLTLAENARHDPCVAIRAVPVVEAMTAIVIADALLMNRCSRL